MHWSSQTPRRYKKSAIICVTSQISDDFEEEVSRIRYQYLLAGFPCGFINEVRENFKFSRFQRLIPENLFEGRDDTPILRLRIPFCQRNENVSHTFLKKLYSFIVNSFKVYVIWNTTKIKIYFR